MQTGKIKRIEVDRIVHNMLLSDGFSNIGGGEGDVGFPSASKFSILILNERKKAFMEFDDPVNVILHLIINESSESLGDSIFKDVFKNKSNLTSFLEIYLTIGMMKLSATTLSDYSQ